MIRWFEGKLDENFYYHERNDELLFTAIQDEVGKLYRFDPAQENCFWFPLSRDKCISVWYCKDNYFGDQLQMKLEQRAQDGSMGPHCEVLINESFYTENLSCNAICETLHEIYQCIGHIRSLEGVASDNRALELITTVSDSNVRELAEKIMSVFALKKRDLEEQIRTARSCTDEQPGISAYEKEQAKEEGRG